MCRLFSTPLVVLVGLLLASPARAQGDSQADDLKAFPAAGDGQVRKVIRLAAQEDEGRFQVELIVGQTVETDEVNRYFFGGTIVESTIQGWGYPRFDVEQLGPLAGTLIAVDPDAPKVERFITLRGEPYLIRYNSRLPIVVYLPKDAELRYRVWTAGPTQVVDASE